MTARKELWPIKPFVFSLGYLGDDEALNSLDWAIVVKGGKRVSNIIKAHEEKNTAFHQGLPLLIGKRRGLDQTHLEPEKELANRNKPQTKTAIEDPHLGRISPRTLKTAQLQKASGCNPRLTAPEQRQSLVSRELGLL